MTDQSEVILAVNQENHQLFLPQHHFNQPMSDAVCFFADDGFYGLDLAHVVDVHRDSLGAGESLQEVELFDHFSGVSTRVVVIRIRMHSWQSLLEDAA